MELNTKQDFTRWMRRLLDPLRGLYSDGRARLHLGDTGTTYSPATIEMEAFSRPLWALVPFWAGGGKDEAFAGLYRRGLAAGADPAPYLAERLRGRSAMLAEYLGDFEDVAMPKEVFYLAHGPVNAAGLVYRRAPNLFDVRFFLADCAEGKVQNVRPVP